MGSFRVYNIQFAQCNTITFMKSTLKTCKPVCVCVCVCVFSQRCPVLFLKIFSFELCRRSTSYMFGTTWGWINVEFYFWVNYPFNPLNPSLLSLSRAEKHLRATSAIGSCPLPFISVQRVSQSHRLRATFFSFRMFVRTRGERDLLCTFPLKKERMGMNGWEGRYEGLLTA